MSYAFISATRISLTVVRRSYERKYFDFVHDPRNGLRTMTSPFEGGLEFTVRSRYGREPRSADDQVVRDGR
jgi:hypothetical protein